MNFIDALMKEEYTLKTIISRRVPKDDVEDVLSDVKLRALRYQHMFTDDGKADSFGRWIRTVAFNLTINRHRHDSKLPRRSSKQIIYSDAEGEDLSAGIQIPSLDQHQLYDGFSDETVDMLSVLDDCQHSVLMMIEIEGNNYQDTADILGIPLGTVRSALFRAKKRLREYVGAGRD